jgi:hypothetical protein
MKKKHCKLVLLFTALVFVGSAAVADDIPDLNITPGSIRVGLTKAKICSIKWGKDARHVTPAMKRQVFQRYGYMGNNDPKCVPAGKRRCEIDHLISRELGGADEVVNLWPQAYGTSPWNAVVKDKLENRLHKEMCAGNISLKVAQDMLVHDWRKAYKKYYGEP